MEITQSEAIGNLATALSLTQSELENAIKNAKNPHFKNNYADLSEVINTVRDTATKHGLAFVQFPGYDAEFKTVTLTTVLTHKSGEWMRGTAGSPVPKSDPQGVGSALTYLRRYSLAAVFGIAHEDDDGEASARRENRRAEEHKDLLTFIGKTNKDTPSLVITVGSVEEELSVHLTKNNGAVKGVLERAREVVRAIERAQENAQEDAQDEETAAA